MFWHITDNKEYGCGSITIWDINHFLYVPILSTVGDHFPTEEWNNFLS